MSLRDFDGPAVARAAAAVQLALDTAPLRPVGPLVAPAQRQAVHVALQVLSECLPEICHYSDHPLDRATLTRACTALSDTAALFDPHTPSEPETT